VAGKKQGGNIVRNVLLPEMQKLAGITCEVKYTERAAHAVELAKEHGSASCGLIAVGGDGTIHEVVDGLLESGKLSQTPLGLLSQGTVNAYAISADLPDEHTLAQYVAQGSFRPGSMMRISDPVTGKQRHCFEAIYIGIGYNGAKGAQDWRHSFLGPMAGIMKETITDNIWPDRPAVTGTMNMVLENGGRSESVTGTFYQMIVCMRNPYNGCLGDTMWISFLALEDYPGFNRMMGQFYAPPFEFHSGLTAVFTQHFEVKSFEWKQTDSKRGPNIGVCLDGDPTDFGDTMRGEVVQNAWKIVAPKDYPKSVQPQYKKVGPESAKAAEWVRNNPPPPGIERTPPGTQPRHAEQKQRGGCC
jgi:diacylglycerol kinase family enzyme